MTKASHESLRPPLGLVLALLGVVLVGIKLLAVSHGDAQTARAILQATGTATVIVGALLPLAQVLLIALVGLVILIATRPSASRQSILVAIVILPVLTSVAIVTERLESDDEGVWVAIIGSILLEAFLALRLSWRFNRAYGRTITRMSEHRVGHPISLIIRWGGVGMAAGALLVALVIGATSSLPWLPSEAIEMRNNETYTAYFLTDDGDDFVLLRDEDRRVLRVPKADVELRYYCTRTSPFTLLFRFDEARYPDCP